MKNLRKVVPKEGDVFIIPIDEERIGGGQVVGTYKRQAIFLAIFDQVWRADEVPKPSDIPSQPLLFLGLSLDGKIHAGHWTVIGRDAVSSSLPLPAFKINSGGSSNVLVEDYSGKRSRPATFEEAAALPFREVVAPVRFEKALKAKNGVGEWDPIYESLRPRWTTTERYFGS